VAAPCDRRLGAARVLGSVAISAHLEPLAHEALLVRRGPRSGLYAIAAVHSTARGPSLGGCRMWTYEDSRAAVRDALRLSRAMTLKNAVAGLPLGGGKGVIMLPVGTAPPAGDQRRDLLLDFGETVHTLGGAYLTAEDVGTSEPDMETIAEVTPHVTGLAVERGGSGDPSPWTALGVEAAIRVACERVFGSTSVEGRSVAIVGVGSVGGRLAELLAEGGADLVLADIDEGRRELADRLGARWTDPESALTAGVDVLAPCALGGVLNDDTVPLIRARAIAGAANNQLAHEAVSEQLASRGILWVPDFVANAGGVVNIAVELEPEGYDTTRAETRVRAIGDTVRTVLDHADATGATPLAAAMEIARRRVAEASVSSAVASSA
jgi:leucine dehydrogenase